MKMKSSQQGYFSPRSIFIVAIMLVMLVIPLWWLGDKSDHGVKQKRPEKIQKSSTSTAVITPTEVNNPDAFGMTWGLMASDALPANAVWMSCHGQPREAISQPHADSCNPYKGDSSCRLALPILCIQKDGSAFETSFPGVTNTVTITTNGWGAGSVASTAPVAGFVIGSLALANARCEKELGSGWHMAEFHDAETVQGSKPSGGGFVAKRDIRLNTRLRHWVHINNQPGNCWNNKG
jgi:hypothetical protein